MACILISYGSCIFRSDIHGMYPNKLRFLYFAGLISMACILISYGSCILQV